MEHSSLVLSFYRIPEWLVTSLRLYLSFSGRTSLASSNSGCCLLSTDYVKNCCKHFICNNSFNFRYKLILVREEITCLKPFSVRSFICYSLYVC